MKAMILAAGRGKRMGKLTEQIPKPLLKVKGRSLIEHLIISLKENGFTELVINTAYKGDQIQAALKSGAQFGVTIQYSDEGGEGLETGGGIFKALPLLGQNHFLVVNADIWTDYPFKDLRTKTNDLAHLVLVKNPEHNVAGDFALEKGRVIEKGAEPKTFSGIGVYHADLFANETAGFFRLAPLLRKKILTNTVSGELYSGQWQDIGTPERLLNLA